MAAQRSSIAVSVTRASLTLATAFALTRVFAGRSWLLAMAAAAIVPPLFLGWSQRRHWHGLVRLAVIVVGGVWLSALVVDPHTTFLGIPTRATLQSLWHALDQAPHTLRAAVVPVAPIGSALVLAFIGVFVAAALTTWIATSLDAPIGAFAPSIALFIVIEAMGGGAWVAPTALYALASLSYLLALAQHDLVARRTWFHAAHRRVSRIAAGGAAIGAIAIITALALGPSVPGAGGTPLLDYKGVGANDANLLSAPPPILHIQDKLTQGPEKELFTVRASRAAYWRVIALDWFTDDNAWGINKATEKNASVLTVPDDLPRSRQLHQQFTIKQIDPHWLPAAYRPVEINLNDARVVPDSLTLLVDSAQPIGSAVYDVQSQIPTPPESLLQRAPLDPEAMPDDIALPNNFPQSIRALARQITAGENGPYGRALALQRYFREDGRFTYTLKTGLDDSADAMVQFLQEKKGFCEQFASTFAAMARSVGVPARVAVGYQPGTYDPVDSLFHVTNRNAHAWPEVYINGAGWIPFEPTPAFREPTLGIGTGGPQRTPTTKPNTASSTTTVSTPSSQRPLPTVAPIPKGGGSLNIAPAAKKGGHHSAVGIVVTGVLIAVGVALLVALVFLGVMLFRLLRRSHRRRNDHDNRQRVLGAWAEAMDHLDAAGVPPKPSATALEFALRHAPAHGAGEAGPALMELARLQSAAMFAPDPPSADEASEAWKQVDAIRAMLRHSVPFTSRWRRRLRPI